MKTPAAIFVESGQPLVVDEIDLPDPGPTQVAVRQLMPLQDMVTRRYTLDQINAACDALARGEIAGRATVTF